MLSLKVSCTAFTANIIHSFYLCLFVVSSQEWNKTYRNMQKMSLYISYNTHFCCSNRWSMETQGENHHLWAFWPVCKVLLLLSDVSYEIWIMMIWNWSWFSLRKDKNRGRAEQKLQRSIIQKQKGQRDRNTWCWSYSCCFMISIIWLCGFDEGNCVCVIVRNHSHLSEA